LSKKLLPTENVALPLNSVSLAVSQTPVYAARPRIRG